MPTKPNTDRAAPTQETTLPERKNPASPNTSYEYPSGDRGDKSGKNLEQQAQASGTPGKPGGRQPTSA